MPTLFAEPSDEFLRIARSQSAVYRQYAALTLAAPLDAPSGLGGKLLFAGDLTAGADLLRAANIAGAASLAASADPAVGRAAMRDGVIDFLVTSLDEALRILKNEIRKRLPVSVAISADPAVVVAEMLERGVLPDLLPPDACDPASAAQFLQQGTPMLKTVLFTEGSYLAWAAPPAAGKRLQQIDNCAGSLLPPGDTARERWLRLAPRYLGRAAQRQHGLVLDPAEEQRFRACLAAFPQDPAATDATSLMLAAITLQS